MTSPFFSLLRALHRHGSFGIAQGGLDLAFRRFAMQSAQREANRVKEEALNVGNPNRKAEKDGADMLPQFGFENRVYLGVLAQLK